MNLKKSLKQLQKEIEKKELELKTEKLDKDQLLERYSQILWQYKSLIKGILRTMKK